MTYYRVTEDRATEVTIGAQRERSFLRSDLLQVTMFNVGAGEAILIVFPGRRAWLVDVGCNSVPRNETLGLGLLDYLEQERLNLEAIVASHSHRDHAGAISTVLGFESDSTRGRIAVYRGSAAWGRPGVWLNAFRRVFRNGWADEEIVPANTHRVVAVPHGEIHLFVGRGASVYTSLFAHLRYRDARFLFTGDSMCPYEIDLLGEFGHDFRADVLKVTHHGSSSGTAQTVLRTIRPGVAIASSTEDADHRLERDVRRRLLARPARREVFETLVHGDITVKTDGRLSPSGILYSVEASTESGNDGEFAQNLGATTMTLAAANRSRSRNVSGADHPECR